MVETLSNLVSHANATIQLNALWGLMVSEGGRKGGKEWEVEGGEGRSGRWREEREGGREARRQGGRQEREVAGRMGSGAGRKGRKGGMTQRIGLCSELHFGVSSLPPECGL